jgi:hypothetical protein
MNGNSKVVVLTLVMLASVPAQGMQEAWRAAGALSNKAKLVVAGAAAAATIYITREMSGPRVSAEPATAALQKAVADLSEGDQQLVAAITLAKRHAARVAGAASDTSATPARPNSPVTNELLKLIGSEVDVFTGVDAQGNPIVSTLNKDAEKKAVLALIPTAAPAAAAAAAAGAAGAAAAPAAAGSPRAAAPAPAKGEEKEERRDVIFALRRQVTAAQRDVVAEALGNPDWARVAAGKQN